MAHITPADLADTSRTLALHAQAVARNLVPAGDAGRLRWVAGCEHARRVATTNGPGLFAAIVRGGRWGLVTQADEDRARVRLREHDRPRTPLPTPVRPAGRMPGRMAGAVDAGPPDAGRGVVGDGVRSLGEVLAGMGIGGGK